MHPFAYWSDFLYPLLLATYSSLLAIGLGALASVIVAGSVVAAERRSVPFQKLAPLTGASLLLLLFYPRQISQASLSYLISLIAGVKFGQSTWGLVLANVPTSAGIAYLLFSTTILLSDYFRLPAAFIKNSGRAPFLRTCVIATIPLRHRLALVTAVVCCTIAFQAAMLGHTGSVTIGTQIKLGLAGNEIADSERVILMSTSVGYLFIILGVVTCVAFVALMLLGTAALRSTARPRNIRIAPNARLVGFGVGATIFTALCVSVILHLFLILRLFGFAHGLLASVGLPAGTLEDSLPTFSDVPPLLEGVVDSATCGALVGCLLAMVVWFYSIARTRSASSARVTMYGPPVLACLAFLPSTFVGSLALALPGIATYLPVTLFLWGFSAAGGLTCLLVSQHLFGARIERYANLRRMQGGSRAFQYFVQEYWLLAVAMVFAVLLGNVFDSGYRDQVGLSSLGTRFVDRQGGWDEAHRGLALIIMGVAVFAVWILTFYSARKGEEMRNMK
jgi:hypothetical protein